MGSFLWQNCDTKHSNEFILINSLRSAKLFYVPCFNFAECIMSGLKIKNSVKMGKDMIKNVEFDHYHHQFSTLPQSIMKLYEE